MSITNSWQKRFDSRYEELGFEREAKYFHNGHTFYAYPCFYCGDPGTTMDHSYPRIALAQIITSGQSVPKRLLKVVPACQECNSLLSDKVFDNIEKRKNYIKKRLRSRYKKILCIPEWTERELSFLGHGLRDAVLSGITMKEHILERLSW